MRKSERNERITSLNTVVTVTSIVFTVLSMVLSVALNLGGLFVKLWTPQNKGGEWASWASWTFAVAVAIVGVVYLLYLGPFRKYYNVSSHQKVRGLRRPWLIGLLAVFLLELTFGIFFGLLFAPRAHGDTWDAIAFIARLEAVFAVGGTLAYYAATVIWSPPKFKYAPWGRRGIAFALGRQRGAAL